MSWDAQFILLAWYVDLVLSGLKVCVRSGFHQGNQAVKGYEQTGRNSIGGHGAVNWWCIGWFFPSWNLGNLELASRALFNSLVSPWHHPTT